MANVAAFIGSFGHDEIDPPVTVSHTFRPETKGVRAEAGFRARTLIGTPKEIAEQLQAFVDVGVETFITSFWDVDDMTPLRTLMNDVAPLISASPHR